MKLTHFRVFIHPAGETWKSKLKKTQTTFFQMLISSILRSPMLSSPLTVLLRKVRIMQALNFSRWIKAVNSPRARVASIRKEIRCSKNDYFNTKGQTWGHEDLTETKNQSADQKMKEWVNEQMNEWMKEPDCRQSVCPSTHPLNPPNNKCLPVEYSWPC